MIRRFIFRKPLGDKTPGTLVEVHVVSPALSHQINFGDYQKLLVVVREIIPNVDQHPSSLYLGITRDVRYRNALADGPLYPKAPIVVCRINGDSLPKQEYPWNDFEKGAPWYKWELR